MVHIPSKLTREWDSAKEGTILRELTFTMGTNVAKKLEGNANNNKNASQYKKLPTLKPTHDTGTKKGLPTP